MNPRGLSTIENIAAVLIIAVASGALIMLLTSQLSIVKAEISHTAGFYLAVEKMEVMIHDGYDTLTSETLAGVPGFPDFSCEVDVAQVADADLTTEVAWGSSNYRRIRVKVKAERIRTIEVESVCGKT